MSFIFLLFLLNLCNYLPSTLALIQPMVRQNTKVWLCYEYDYAGIDYGLYLDDYDMSVIYYNTVTM